MSKQLPNQWLLRNRAKPNHRGFSLVEVMVSILVLGLFTLSASSLMVYAAQNRVSARSDSEVTDRLQRMMEEVRDEAAILPVSTTACSATTVANGYGQLLSNAIPAANATVTLNGRVYTVTRTLAAVNEAPFTRLTVTYTLTPQSSATASDTITMQTEVIPDAAFNCS